ncbi:MAG: hypothetical protein I8H73_14025, partial [Pseudomonadales bacterium]|nr:hypothetical protein [Pseudomonadales bacterium]
SMGSQDAGTNPKKTRNQVLKTVVNDLIDQIKVKEDVNVGFMRYDGNDGGYILSPLQRLTNTNATAMKAVVNAIPADGNTPLLETYYESYRYMSGKNRVWGDKSVASSLSGEKYILPISHSCQKSHIIYVTDGEPTQDTSSNATVKTLVTGKNTLYPGSSCGNGQGACLPHLAEYMANQDLVPTPTPFDDPTNRKQTVTSHFIGFTVDLPLLKNAASAGGGSYYTSNNVSGLTDALKAIIVDITADNTSFAAPSVAVSAFNNFGYRNDLYYALFKPQEGARWPGNVKRYKLGEDTNGSPLIMDKNGNAAIDDSTGFFSSSSSSFWSTADGADVAKGGVAAQLLTPDTRKLFTWTSADRTPTLAAGVTGSSTLDVATNRILDSNNSLTQAMLGASTSTERTTYINWARGKNTDGSTRLAVGDVLHNEPKLVAYVTDENLSRVNNSQKPASDPDYQVSPEKLYMFFGSNEGFIHAINPVDGTEKFAFMPKELLSNPRSYFDNAKGSESKRYGIDGQINIWTEYNAPASDSRTLSKAYLYAGMRRGGSNYYALDVTDINAPALKWIIKGPKQTSTTSALGVVTVSNDASVATPGYEKLGQTFSAPKLANIKVTSGETSVMKKVLIFTGGYDLDQDILGANTQKDDDLGNALFIADAETGKLIWSASKTGASLNLVTMTNSMPATPTIVDIDGDGAADMIYASDLRGQIFRFDINAAYTGNNALASGIRLANLGGATAENNRRFFSSPDVALIRERGGKSYLTIAIGSGHRESPLNTDTKDRFYVVRDSNVISKPTDTVATPYVAVTESDLVDVSSVDLTSAQAIQIQADIQALETQMTSLNTSVSTAQENFISYKAGIGHTTQATSALQATSDANDKQRQIDELLASDPYLLERAPNTKQQSILQDSLTLARSVLAGVEQARVDAQALADSTDATALTTAAANASAALTSATTDYNSAKIFSDIQAANAAHEDEMADAGEVSAAAAAIGFAEAEAAKTAADAAFATAQADAATALATRNTAATAFSAADAEVLAKQSAQTAAADNVVAAGNAVSVAQTAVTDAQDALTVAENAVPFEQADVDQAQSNLGTANDTLTTAIQNKSDSDELLAEADADLLAATTSAASALTAKGAAEDALLTADNLVIAKTTDQAAAATALVTATTARDSTAAAAVSARAIADSTASAAAASGAITATKLTVKNDAQTAKAAADVALATGAADDAAALALTTQRDRMAAEYETLINLQATIDNSYAAIQAKEVEIAAGSAANNDVTALEAELAALRTGYAASAGVAKRTDLNAGTPTLAVTQLNAVNAALSAGNAAAVAALLNTALTTLETGFGAPSLPPSNTTSALIARDEASKSANLLATANNEASTAALIANLQNQKAALLATAAGYQSQADTLAAGLYNPASGLLTAAQVAAANATGRYSNPLTTFDAYQYLTDISLAAANDLVTGIPALRTQINNKYNQLTPGNSYTPNQALLSASKGFYLRLPKGEKVLSTSISYRGGVLFSTFSPRGATTSICGSDVGRGRTYAISLTDANAIFATTINGVETPVRYVEMKRSGIPPTPSIILGDNGPTFLTGTEVLNNDGNGGAGLFCREGVDICKEGDSAKATYWREN